MVVPLLRSAPGTKVLLFGPQALAFDEESASQLRSTLLDTPGFSWVLDTIAELPGYWDTLSETVPSLQHFPGAKLLEDLNNWLRTGEFTQASFPLPNVLLTPLVIITHLAQYLKFLELIQPDAPESHDLHAAFKRDGETLGLCSGLLSAAAVSCSADQAELHHYGPVAMRLAMLVGALVDAQDVSADLQGGSKAFSVAWNSPETGVKMEEIMKSFPEVSNLLTLSGRESFGTDPRHLAGIHFCPIRQEASYSDSCQKYRFSIAETAECGWCDCCRCRPSRKLSLPMSSR
jgi:Starter unit:ACP transacylase in aflatoxin biosynthesis